VGPKPATAGPRGKAVNVVFLVGFMGAGKTSVGRALAQRVNWIFEDLDDRIVAREGRTVAEIFRDAGETEFRRAEHAALGHVLKELQGGVANSGNAKSVTGQTVVAKIIALGGGAFVQKENAALLKACGVPTVFLDAPVEELWQRCRTQANATGAERPLLQNREQFGKLHATRHKSYSKAFLKVQTSGRAVETIAAEITKKLGLKKIAVRTETVRIEEGEVE
jgi:shikimate kinase